MAASFDADEVDLPRATVLRCIRSGLQNQGIQVPKDSLDAVIKSSRVFILYITSRANDVAMSEGRSTITANDVLAAIKESDFEEFMPELIAVIAATQEKKSKQREKDKLKSTNDAKHDEKTTTTADAVMDDAPPASEPEKKESTHIVSPPANTEIEPRSSSKGNDEM